MDEAEARDDLAAIQRVLSGDKNAFRILVERYGNRVLRFCRARLPSEEEAADAAQEVFLRAYRSLRHFRFGQSFASWLFATAANRIRTRKVRAGTEKRRIAAAAAEASVSIRLDPSEDALRAGEAERIRAAVASLPFPLRSAVEFYYFAGLSIRDSASALHIGEEAAKSRLFRARRILREILEKEQRGPARRGI